MNFFENITQRRKRTKSDTTNTVNESPNDTFEDTANSLPDLSIDDVQHSQISILKEQIGKLVLELNSAHREIETLSLANNSLKQVNIDLQRKNDILSKINNSPIKKTKASTPIKKCSRKSNKQTQTEPSLRSEIHNKTCSKNIIQHQIPQLIEECNIYIFSTNNTNKIRSIPQNTLHKHSENI